MLNYEHKTFTQTEMPSMIDSAGIKRICVDVSLCLQVEISFKT